jgi:hypothetical protein
LLKEIERLKKQVEAPDVSKSHIPGPGQVELPGKPIDIPAERGMMMTTDSGGGSLALRSEPDLGSPENTARVPHQSAVRILNQSNKSIRLDGQVAYWIQIEYDGQVEWILDTYLR